MKSGAILGRWYSFVFEMIGEMVWPRKTPNSRCFQMHSVVIRHIYKYQLNLYNILIYNKIVCVCKTNHFVCTNVNN